MSSEWIKQLGKVIEQLVVLGCLLPPQTRRILLILTVIVIMDFATDFGFSLGKALYLLTH